MSKNNKKELTNKDYDNWEDFFNTCDQVCSKCKIVELCDAIINHESKIKQLKLFNAEDGKSIT